MTPTKAKLRGKSVAQREPALVIGSAAALIVALASIFHVVLDVNTVTGILVTGTPLIAAILTRLHVTPVA